MFIFLIIREFFLDLKSRLEAMAREVSPSTHPAVTHQRTPDVSGLPPGGGSRLGGTRIGDGLLAADLRNAVLRVAPSARRSIGRGASSDVRFAPRDREGGQARATPFRRGQCAGGSEVRGRRGPDRRQAEGRSSRSESSCLLKFDRAEPWQTFSVHSKRRALNSNSRILIPLGSWYAPEHLKSKWCEGGFRRT
jgi:hypothetical protein